MTTLTRSQENALKRIRNFIEKRFMDFEVEKYGAEITEFKVGDAYKGVNVSVETDYTNMREGSALALVSHNLWGFNVGRRGGVNCYYCPDSFRQFAGQYAFGIKFDRRVKELA